MKIFKHSFLILLVLIMLFPVIFVIMGATNNSGWAFEIPFKFTFGSSFIDNYVSITTGSFNVWQSLLISMSSSLLVTIISTTIIFLASYALTKFNFKHKDFVWIFFIVLSLIPQPSYLVGQLDVINKLGMYSTFIGLVLPTIINLRVLIYMKEYFAYLPDQLIEAGREEGASEWTIMWRIVVPNMKDKLGMAAFLIFVSSWNNFLIPMIITSDSKLFNLPTLISSLADPLRYNIGAVFMALLFSIIPVMLIFLITSKWIYEKE